MLGWGSLLDQINTGLSGVDDPAVAPEPHKISLKKKKGVSMATGNLFLKEG